MLNETGTRNNLLVRMSDKGDHEAWKLFVDFYRPLMHTLARRWRLQDADVADFTQEVFHKVARGIGRFKYDQKRGSFDSWFYAVARNKLYDMLARRRRYS